MPRGLINDLTRSIQDAVPVLSQHSQFEGLAMTIAPLNDAVKEGPSHVRLALTYALQCPSNRCQHHGCGHSFLWEETPSWRSVLRQ